MRKQKLAISVEEMKGVDDREGATSTVHTNGF